MIASAVTRPRAVPVTLFTQGAIWIGAAVIAGLVAGILPLEIAGAVVALSAAALCIVISPLSALVLLLTLSPLRTLIATESTLRLPLDIGQLVLALTLGIWFVHRMASQRLPRLPFSPLYIAVIPFVIATGITAFSAVTMGAWLNEWLKWIQILLLIALCLDLAVDRRWEWLIFALTAAGLANALVGVYQFFGGSGALHLLINDRFFRAFGTFGQPNPFGGFMGLIAPVALAAALGYGWRTWKAWRLTGSVQPITATAFVFYAGAGSVIAGTVILSWSRGAWLGLGAALFAVVICIPRKGWQSLLTAVVVAALSAVLWISGALPDSIVERISSAFSETFATNDVRGVDITPENYALVERLAHWQAAVNMATENPYLGVGFGNYEAAYEQYRLINWKFPLGHAHNYYLNVLAEAGIIGFVTYLTMWVIVMTLTWRARRHPDPLARIAAAGLFGAWAYLLTHSLTDNLYVNNLFLHIGVMFGTLAVLYRQCHTKGHLRNA